MISQADRLSSNDTKIAAKIGMDGSRFFGMMYDILHARLQGEDFSNLTLPESRLLSTPWNLNPVENIWQFMRDNWLSNCSL